MSRTRQLLDIIYKWGVLAAIVGTIGLAGVHVLLGAHEPIHTIPKLINNLSRDVIANLIPVLLLFAISYVLFRQFQDIHEDHKTDELADKIANRIRVPHPTHIQGLLDEAEYTRVRQALTDNDFEVLLFLEDYENHLTDEIAQRVYWHPSFGGKSPADRLLHLQHLDLIDRAGHSEVSISQKGTKFLLQARLRREYLGVYRKVLVRAFPARADR